MAEVAAAATEACFILLEVRFPFGVAWLGFVGSEESSTPPPVG